MLDLHVYFSGRWRFTRTVLGIDGPVMGNADGQAEFLAVTPSLLHYKESGRLRLTADQREISFSRCFDYQVAGDLVHVTFADGVQAGQAYQSYRHDPVQQALLPLATHLCASDRYDGRYVLIDADHFDLQTRIEGPHKNHFLHTHFSRWPDLDHC